MFSLLISASSTSWETDQFMRMSADRFREYSGEEAKALSINDLNGLKVLQDVHAILMYESGTKGMNTDIARLGHLTDIHLSGGDLVFRFNEFGRLKDSVVDEFAERLGMGPWERNRTHWAVKDGDIPAAFLDRVIPTYDVVFSFAGEDRQYVEQVAQHLKEDGVKVFYDRFEEASLWGKDLVEHLDLIYRKFGKRCVMFISTHYVTKLWTSHERKSALAKALEDDQYVLPVRFDETEVPGLRPTIAYLDARTKTPVQMSGLILQKLRKQPPKTT